MDWLTTAAVAQRLQVSPATVLRWIRAKRLPAILPGGSKTGYRVSVADLRVFEQRSATMHTRATGAERFAAIAGHITPERRAELLSMVDRYRQELKELDEGPFGSAFGDDWKPAVPPAEDNIAVPPLSVMFGPLFRNTFGRRRSNKEE